MAVSLANCLNSKSDFMEPCPVTHTLITFLGRAGNYQTTTYRFPDNETVTTRFFGLALRRKLQPDRLVMFGTSGSAWDVICLDDDGAALTGEALDAVDQVETAARANQVTQELLNPLAEPISQRLGFEVRFRVIDYAEKMAEQLGLLQAMADEVKTGDHVSLDVTHGFRHLPMLAFLSALHLRTARQVNVEGLYYGALEMKQNGVAPVMNLAGLLRIADWTGAVQSFDKDGDYGVFAALIREQSPSVASLLQESAFYERTMRPGQARNKLRELATLLDQQHLTGIGSLFAPTLRTRLSWHQEDRLYLRQQALARLYLEHDDFLRAALLGYEAFITRLMYRQGKSNPDNWTQREGTKKQYEETNNTPGKRGEEYKDYCRLRDLRNHLAHGNMSPQAEIQQHLASAERLRAFLDGLLKRLLPLP